MNTSTSIHDRRRGASAGRHLTALLLVVLAGAVAVPASALAGNWGPRSSYYDGTKRVTANGGLFRKSGGSTSLVTATDNRADGWPIYGYTRWRVYKNGVPELGTSVIQRSTPEVYNATTSGGWTIGWTNPYGFWVEAGGCAQAGWPVPNNCTSPYVESHRP